MAERRNTPNPDRPRLSRKAEQKLLPMDRMAAEAYTLIEDGMAKLDEFLAAEGGVVTDALAEGGDTQVHRVAAMLPTVAPVAEASAEASTKPGGADDE